MSTGVTYPVAQTTTVKQPTPGAVTTTTVTTVPSQPVATNRPRTREYGKLWDAVTVLSDICYLVGSILIIIGAGLVIGHKNSAGGILYIIGFSFWLVAAIFNIAQGAVLLYQKRSVGRGWSIFAGILYFCSMILWVVGAALWESIGAHWGGQILWVIAGGMLTLSATIRLFLVHHSAYKVNPHDVDKVYLTRHWLSHVYVDTWFLISVLFLIGAILYLNNIRPYYEFASILWIIGSGCLILGSFLNFFGRRA